MGREECKRATLEDIKKYRTKSKYSKTIEELKCSDSVDLKKSKGIKSDCSLNKLMYFHVLDNMNVDIMHDLLEGTVPFVVKNVVLYCIDKKIFSESEINNSIRFMNYGRLNSKNIPNPLNLARKNLGQNASQMKCLFQHLPLILYPFREHELFTNVWTSIHTMLRILQIVYSPSITESDLDDLKILISNHLQSLIDNFNVDLIPKHHLMTHYPTVIRMIGPLVHTSTMKYEMKHKNFTNFIKRSNNFRNVSKSLSSQYQRSEIHKKPFTNNITHAPMKDFSFNNINFDECLLDQFTESRNISKVNWVKFNSNYYAKGLIMKSEKNFYKIEEILHLEEEYHFVCTFHQKRSFNHFLQCIELEECQPVQFELFKHSNLSYKKTHEAFIVDGRNYIIIDSLEMLDPDPNNEDV